MQIDFLDPRGQPVVICGYFARYNSNSNPGLPDLPGADWVERIKEGAFDRCLESSRPVQALINHDRKWWPLATTSDGALRFWRDGHGMAFEIVGIPVIPRHAALLTEIAAGRCGCSWAGSWQYRNDREAHVRTIETVDSIDEITIAAWGERPAFAATATWLAHQSPQDVGPYRHKLMAQHYGGREFGLQRVSAYQATAAALAKPPALSNREKQRGRSRR